MNNNKLLFTILVHTQSAIARKMYFMAIELINWAIEIETQSDSCNTKVMSKLRLYKLMIEGRPVIYQQVIMEPYLQRLGNDELIGVAYMDVEKRFVGTYKTFWDTIVNRDVEGYLSFSGRSFGLLDESLFVETPYTGDRQCINE